MFRDGEIGGGRGSKRKREKERMDPKKSRRPELPVTGPGKGGRVGASATQHVVQNLVRDTTRDQDVSVPVALLFLLVAWALCPGVPACTLKRPSEAASAGRARLGTRRDAFSGQVVVQFGDVFQFSLSS